VKNRVIRRDEVFYHERAGCEKLLLGQQPSVWLARWAG
jgi:hypothetical protein